MSKTNENIFAQSFKVFFLPISHVSCSDFHWVAAQGRPQLFLVTLQDLTGAFIVREDVVHSVAAEIPS